jgi:WD40-like Beta Propeller Repeat
MTSMLRSRVAFFGAVLIAICVVSPAGAQYFGRNKVQYEMFDFQVMKTEHFDVYYYPRERETVEEAARLSERWHARLSTILQHRLRGRQPLILYASHPDFEQTTAIPGFIGESTGGVTELLQRRIVLPLTGSLAETNHVLGHELVHAFQFDMGGRRSLRLPLWFIEGMAEYLSLGPVHAHTAVWLRDALIHDNLPDFADLGDPDYFPYRFGHAAWAYLAGHWGDDFVPQLFMAALAAGDPIEAIRAGTGMDPEALSKQWHQSIAGTYATLGLKDGDARGVPLITGDQAGEVNVGPSMSPDGRRLVFLSEKDLFSIEMFLADARTGDVIRKLTETATSPHLDSIQFLHSTAAWAPDSRQLAMATVKAGRAALRIVDATNGDTIRDVTFDAFGEVLQPAWSPDGRTVAFAANVGGTSDLFLYSVEAGTLRRLTRDLFADLQPAWSPDGRTLAFVTDRFTTNLGTLAFGDYRLARLDVQSGSIAPVAGFNGAKHIDPQWSPDGRAIYFVSDPNGIPNVYRLEIAASAAPVTAVATGVTGITELSPALSVAAQTGTLAYTVYADGKYTIHTLEGEAGTPARVARADAAVLPPRSRESSRVATLLNRAQAGLPPQSAAFPSTDYDPDLSLTYAGAAVGARTGVDGFGTFIGGGVSLLFSDVLGQHSVSVTADASGRLRDFGGQIGYLNQQRRWNWGFVGQQLPLTSAVARQGLGTVDGRQAIIEQVEIFRQTEREATGLTQYPFNRAARLEFSAGVRHISFDHEVQTQAFSPITGQLILDRTSDLPSSEPLTMGVASTAFVYDTSIFGATSPVLGTRSRLEVTPVLGALNFSEVLADYRRY